MVTKGKFQKSIEHKDEYQSPQPCFGLVLFVEKDITSPPKHTLNI